ncbi:hypothetical protein D5018_21290 [Parashewanella curva]|uniref:DUF3784 domain-containing protein n=1 Tax=Parashewanella curva TaxID=2338552 RepID=A0A3L8PS97_9GAMM|nr:hypothetical protein [Parashewanella curva]RLV57679.1 hypothetical protein D5018_21290 [Parashewanella curva]
MTTYIISIALIITGLTLTFWGYYVSIGRRWELIPNFDKEDCNDPDAFLKHMKVGLLVSGLALSLSGLILNFSTALANTGIGLVGIFLVIWNLKRNKYINSTEC